MDIAGIRTLSMILLPRCLFRGIGNCRLMNVPSYSVQWSPPPCSWQIPWTKCREREDHAGRRSTHGGRFPPHLPPKADLADHRPLKESFVHLFHYHPARDEFYCRFSENHKDSEYSEIALIAKLFCDGSLTMDSSGRIPRYRTVPSRRTLRPRP